MNYNYNPNFHPHHPQRRHPHNPFYPSHHNSHHPPYHPTQQPIAQDDGLTFLPELYDGDLEWQEALEGYCRRNRAARNGGFEEEEDMYDEVGYEDHMNMAPQHHNHPQQAGQGKRRRRHNQQHHQKDHAIHDAAAEEEPYNPHPQHQPHRRPNQNQHDNDNDEAPPKNQHEAAKIARRQQRARAERRSHAFQASSHLAAKTMERDDMEAMEMMGWQGGWQGRGGMGMGGMGGMGMGGMGGMGGWR